MLLNKLQLTALLLPFCCLIALHPSLSVAYSWQLDAPPVQCSNLSITITGSDGVPPYRVLIVPFGPSPTSQEVRRILDFPLEGNTTTFSFPINYPASSGFLVVVSDTRGFGSGGTSVELLVANSNNNGCFSISNPFHPYYFFYADKDQFFQCGTAIISWNGTNVQGTPTFLGVIPGGQSFPIQVSNISTNATTGRPGFPWTLSIREQTTFLIVSNDNRGTGAGGSAQFTVGNSDDASCLSNLSPSSTPGTPAGSYATGAVGPGSAGDSSKRTKRAALIGGVVGGVAGGLALIFLIGLAFYYSNRNKREAQQLTRSRPPSSIVANRLTASTSWGDQMSSQNSHLAHYNPEPFMVSSPVTSVNNERMDWGSSVPLPSSRQSGLTSMASSTTIDRSSGAFGASSMMSNVFQPVRKGSLQILQHQDAGPSESMPVGTIELPPQYDNLSLRQANTPRL